MSTADRTDDQAEQPCTRWVTNASEEAGDDIRLKENYREPAKRICLSFDLVGKRLGFYFADKYLASIGPSQNVC